MIDWQTLLDTIVGWIMSTGIKIIIAFIILIVTFKIINFVARKIEKKLKDSKRHVDKTLSSVFIYVFKLTLKILVVLCLVAYLGIDTSGITALITSLGVTVGLAVNGALGNLAGGVLLLITRPFKVDDYIDACGCEGTVECIHITNTKLRTPDNKVIYLPNGTLSAASIINYSEKETRRVEVVFSVAYGSDYQKAKKIIRDICEAHPLILQNDGVAPFVSIKEHADSSINIVARVWTKNSDYWTVHFDLLESVLNALEENNIEIPYNKLDVHITNN